jgi:hypothetical protein
VDFKFKFELFSNFPIYVLIATCKRASNFLIQVSQSKFIVLKIMSRKIFGEFMGFSPEGLNSFKIQESLKFDLFPRFLIQNPERFFKLDETGNLFHLN